MKYSAFLFIALVLALPARAGGDSSDGHTHAAPEPTLAVSTAPRTVAASEDFELVGVLDGKTLTLYLDRFASNEPVAGARIEVESGALKAAAAEISPGVYALPAGPLVTRLAEAGKHLLTISLEAGDSADLLDATLEVGANDPGVAHTHARSEWVVWSAATALLLTGALLIALRRHRHLRTQKRAAA